jgi:hypothetical protein
VVKEGVELGGIKVVELWAEMASRVSKPDSAGWLEALWLELARPQTPYHQGLHCRPLAPPLMVLERISDDSMSASFLSFPIFIFIIRFVSFLFPWAAGFKQMSVVKQSENGLI